MPSLIGKRKICLIRYHSNSLVLVFTFCSHSFANETAASKIKAQRILDWDYLIDFAKQMGFDPSKPENWANVTNAQIRAIKVPPEFPLFFWSR